MGYGTLRRFAAASSILAVGMMAVACGQVDLPPHLKPLSKDTLMLLGKKQMKSNAPIFVRVFKEESELEVWKQRVDGHFYHFKTYPICTWSGDVGPKMAQGDKQAPEGFYSVARHQMNPNSQFYLAFNLGYPNAFDRANNRTGDFLMVHGKCKSVGCYAMTDGLIEEIYALAREAFIGGQDGFHVHAFPFRMTDANMARHSNHTAQKFWTTLKEGYDHFEITRQVPSVAVCERRYVVNPKWRQTPAAKLEAEQMCPAFDRQAPEPFKPQPTDVVADAERVVAPGPRLRSGAGGDAPPAQSATGGMSTPAFGLGRKQANVPAFSFKQ
jgi:murein L,D-transpeptidase YafK